MMSKKKKIFDTLIVGSGLSSLFFIESYLKRNKKINVLSFENKKINFIKKYNKHIFKILPPQMLGSENQVNNYFFLNKIKVNPESNYFGSLEFGGLSNYWGLQIDKNITQDISHLKKKTQLKILKSFKEIFKNCNLIGGIDNKNQNLYERNEYISENFIKTQKNLIFEEPILAYQKKKERR